MSESSRNKDSSLPLSTCCWKSCRVCCCRFGWFPILVSVVATVAAGFSTSSAVGCDFVLVNIGFEPANIGWNSSSIVHGGLWYVETEDTMNAALAASNRTETSTPASDIPVYSSLIPSKCRRYSDDFEEEFIQGDRAWKIARIMGLIAGSASGALALMSWIFVVTAVPACMWQACLLPLNMVAFVAEGSKFLLYDISLCRNPLWLPSGIDSESQAAESCKLGESARGGLVACSLLLVGLVMVCIQAPRKRKLDENYGTTHQAQLNDAENPSGSRGASFDPQEDESYDDFTDELPYGSHYSGSHYSEETPLESVGQYSVNSEEASFTHRNLDSTTPLDALAPDVVSSSKVRISESRLQALQNMRQSTAALAFENSKRVRSFVQDVEMEFKSPDTR